jgi:transaldolase/transaldolase/glucose-6-phosphate isomerase
MRKLHELLGAGQSVWFDYIRRDMVREGELARLVDDGIRGVTSNPSIFEKAIADTDLYDDQIAALAGSSPEEVFDELAIVDIAEAADVLAPVFRSSGGVDGYVSLEVSPRLARDTSGTIADAMRLWGRVDRPNLMIKVPATPEGIPAVEELTAAGINVNATLMFSLGHYEAVASAYLRGAERASDPSTLASVASFFVSRVDTYADEALSAIGSSEALELRGTLAVANAKAAYARYLQIFEGEPFSDLAARGTRPQRVLWASTSTKNPEYRDVMYVEDLIGPNTVNTAPPQTIEDFEDHGVVRAGSLMEGMEAAAKRIRSLDEIGLDFDDITNRLQDDGVDSFAAAYEGLIEAIAHKQGTITS